MNGKPIPPQDLGPLIQKELEYSDNRQGSETQQNTWVAYDYMLYRAKGDEVEGRSQIQSGDVADVIDHVHAEIQPMLDVEQLVEIRPEGAQDVEQAELETKALNWYYKERCRGREKLDDAIQDGLLLRNGFIKVWPEDSFRLPYVETLEGTSDQIDAALAMLAEDGSIIRVQSQEVIQEAQYETVSGIGPDGITTLGAEVEVAPRVERVEVLIIHKQREILMEPVAREDMFISRDATDQNLQKPRLVAQRRWMTRNEAIALGLDHDDVFKITATDHVTQQTKVARLQDAQTRTTKAAHQGGDLIAIYEVYYLVDADGDGHAERHKVFYAERRVLRWGEHSETPGEYADEIVRLVPFASGSPLKLAHRHQGRSLFDKERAIEDGKRSLLRQGLDNVEQANNRRPLLGPGVDPDDVEETEIGAYIRCSQGIEHYGETQFTPMFSETLLGLDYMDKIRRERGGAAVEHAGPGFLPGNTAAHTAERTMSATEQLAAMMARNYANTLIRDSFVILHQQLKLAGEALSFEDGDDWQSTEPRHWMDRERFTVNLGLSQGERMRRASAYEGHFHKQMALAQSGKDGVLVDDQNIYECVTAQANVQGLVDADQMYTAPDSEQAELARMQRANAMQQQQQFQQMMQQTLINAELQRTQMQEETKRLGQAQEQVQAHLDRIAKYIIEMTKIEEKTKQDVPGGVLIAGEGEELPEPIAGGMQ